MYYVFLFVFLILLFIIGMTMLRKGLFRLSANSFKCWLTKMTDTPLKGLFAGMIVTALLHSSSAVMVITIGLISTRLLTFNQSIGIILGSNIGTTFTLEIITYNLDGTIVPFAVFGAFLLIMENERWRNIGRILFGIAAVFAAMRGFTFLAEPISDIPEVQFFFERINEEHYFGVLTGAILTAIIQSSTAMTGIIMGFLLESSLNMDIAIAIMLGANVGTCVTALLASVGGGKEAKLTAYAHIGLNVLGVISFYPFIDLLTVFASYTKGNPDAQLAHVSVLFNLLSSLAVLPFARQFGKVIEKIYGDLDRSDRV